MSHTGHSIQLKNLDQVPLYPVIKTSNVINDANFIGVSDSGELGQILTKTASGAKWMDPPTAPASVSDATSAFFLQMTQDNVDYGTFTFSNVNIPVAIETPSGHYYIIQKSSVYMGETNATLDLAPYLAYQGVSTFTGTWKLYVVTSFRSDISTLLRDLSDSIASIKSSLASDYYNKEQVDQLLEDLSNSIDLSNYYTKAQIDAFLSDSSQAPAKAYNYRVLTADAVLSDRDFAVCDANCTLTLPTCAQGSIVTVSITKKATHVYISPASGDRILITDSDSTSQGIQLDDYYDKVSLLGTTGGWIFAEVSSLQNNYIQGLDERFSDYYNKAAVDAIKGALSDSIASIKSSLESDYYTKEQVDQLLEEFSDSVDLSNYYTKGEVDQLLEELSNSVDLSDYYNKEQIDAIAAGLSGSISFIRGLFSSYYNKTQVDGFIENISDSLQNIRATHYTKTQVDALLGQVQSLQGASVSFNSVTDNKVTFTGLTTLPVIVVTDKGSAYPIQKGSLIVDSSVPSFTLDVTPYLAYDNSQSFSGTWTLYLTAGNVKELFGDLILQLDSAHFAPQDSRIYECLLTESDSFTFDMSAFTGSKQVTFELHLIQPSTAVTFTLPASLIWPDGDDFDSANPPPAMSTADTLYCIVIRWDGSDLLSNLAYKKAIEVSA